MILIAHRGNTSGPMESWENEPTYIDLAISKGFDVEVDVWYVDGLLYLGHDKPQYGVDFRWFRDRVSRLWVHCKNIEAVIFFKTNQYEFNYFWHETDTITLTSLNHIWAYPAKQPIQDSIAVMPEIHNDDTTQCLGVCSDFIDNYNDSEPLILSTSEEISIKDVVEIITENMNFKGNVVFDKTKPDGQFRKPSDNSKLKSYLPDFKFTSFETGIKETIGWFENKYPNIKQ